MLNYSKRFCHFVCEFTSSYLGGRRCLTAIFFLQAEGQRQAELSKGGIKFFGAFAEVTKHLAASRGSCD